MNRHSDNRRPPPSTGRQDRHRSATPPQPPGPEMQEPAEDALPPETGAYLPPRGRDHYNRGRSHDVGFGCLVFFLVACLGIAVVLVAVGFMPMGDDLLPAGALAPGSEPADTTTTPAGDGGGGGGDAGLGEGVE